METGFRRLAWVACAMLGIWVMLAMISGAATLLAGDYILAVFFALAIPWGIFYTIRWVVLGFQREG